MGSKNGDYRDRTCRDFMSNWCLSGSCHKCDSYKKERADELQAEFEKSLPCFDCKDKDICKYTNSIKRFDFNKEMFVIEIKCIRRGLNENTGDTNIRGEIKQIDPPTWEHD